MKTLKNITVLEVIKQAGNIGMALMGDDFIGFKLIGANSEFWNTLLKHAYEEDDENGVHFTEHYLKENGITVFPYNSDVWNQY